MATLINDSGPNQPIRVVIVDSPAILMQLIESAIQQQEDMAYLGTIKADVLSEDGNLRLLQLVQDDIDVLLLHVPNNCQLLGIFTHLLDQHKDLRLLVVSEIDESMCVYWMGLHRKRLNNVSIGSLLDSIRYLANLNPMLEDYED